MNFKRILITSIIGFAVSISLNAQENNGSSLEHKNEFGVDVTGFIRFFTKFQNSSDYYYNPVYYIIIVRLKIIPSFVLTQKKQKVKAWHFS